MKLIKREYFKTGSKGNLSNFLNKCKIKTFQKNQIKLDSPKKKSYLICSQSACQRNETKISYIEDILWYENLLKECYEIKEKLVLIFISSQTIYLDSENYYAKSKIDIEKLLLKSDFQVLILRFGFLLNKEGLPIQPIFKLLNKFNVGFPSSIPKFAYLKLQDFLETLEKAIFLNEKLHFKVFDIGARDKHINELIFANKKPWFILKIPRIFILIISTFFIKLRKILSPNSQKPTAHIRLD